MKFVVTIERVVKETIVYFFDRETSLEALDSGLDYCDKLNKSAHDQSSLIKTSYHVSKVETQNE